MAELFNVEKKIRMDRWDIVKFQLLTHCYLNRIHVSQHDLACLTLLAITGTKTLEDFCEIVKTNRIFSSNQSARNALSKAEKKGLIVKEGTNKKKISINPELKIQASGNIVLNFRMIYVESVKQPKLELQES